MAKTDKSAVDAFVDRCKAAARDRKIKISTLSLYILNDGKVLGRLIDGGAESDIGTRKREAAEAELAKLERGKPTTYQIAQGLSGNGPAPVRPPRRHASAG